MALLFLRTRKPWLANCLRTCRLVWVICIALGTLAVAGSASAALAIDSVTLNGGASVTVLAGATITVAVSEKNTGGDNWGSVRFRTTDAGGNQVTTCIDTPDHNGNGTYSETFNITAPAATGTYDVGVRASSNNNCGGTNSSTTTLTGGIIVVAGPPSVSSINRASFDPTTSNTVVAWTVTFDQSVTGVDASDFSLTTQAGVATGLTIANVTGSGTTWTVTANTGGGTAGTLKLNLVDNDSIVNASSAPLGGVGAGNGTFSSGQSYTILAPVCTGAADIIFCDDFERSNAGTVGNGWTVTENNAGNCNGAAGNRRCAGIDSDIPPFNTYSNPRANATRSLFTRWDRVWVTSPTISMAGKIGGQFSVWMRRGNDDFSECPEATGENYLVEYYASDSTWKPLAQYPSSPSAALCDGQIWTPTIELPADALHANFKLRFYQPSGSGDSGSGGAPGVVGYDYWHMDNVIIREKAAPSFVGAFCDNFEGGLGRWSITAEGAPSGATIGDASLGTLTNQSPSHSLDLRWGYVMASTFKTDITGVSGNITYWVKSGAHNTTNNATDRDPDAGEDLVVDYLNSSGNWVNLATYLGSAAADTVYNATFAIPADAKHTNFRLRFKHLNASGYDLDYWHVDNVCVGDPTQSDLSITKTHNGSLVPSTNATYSIVITNNGPNAMSGALQITDTLPATLSYLSGTGTNWSCSAGGTGNRDITCSWAGSIANGATADILTLTVAVSPSATGSISNTAAVTSSVTDSNTANNSSTDVATLYIPSYVFTDKPCPTGVAIGSGANPCQLIGWSPQTAGKPLSGVYVTALNSSSIPTQLNATNPTTVNFQFALSCINPVSDAGVQATVSAAGSTLPVCTANGAVPTSWSTSAGLVFAAGSPSVGPYSFQYNDAGNVELYIRNSVATAQIGQSGQFVVKPAGFCVYSADLAACGSADATCPKAKYAGETFNLTVKAVVWESDSDPDLCYVGSTSTLQVAAPNFKTTGITLGSELIAPAIVDGGFSGSVGVTSIDISSNGWASTNQTISEVGVFKFTATPPGYLGVSLGGPYTTGSFGRFHPHHFDTTVVPGCGTFTYSGQPFASVKVQAMNGLATPTATKNYLYSATATKNFAHDISLTARDATGATANPGPGTLAPVSPQIISSGFASEGNATVTTPAYTFDAKLTAPTVVRIRADDATDLVSSSSGTEGTVTLRSGRLRLSNAFGSEKSDLSMAMQAQYWSGLSWVSTSDDLCSAAKLSFTAVGTDITSKTCVRDTGSPGSSGQGCAAVAVAANQYKEAGTLVAGNFNLWLKAPGTGNTESINVTATIPVWLQYNWTGLLGNPAARATFGVYAPETRKSIHVREQF